LLTFVQIFKYTISNIKHVFKIRIKCVGISPAEFLQTRTDFYANLYNFCFRSKHESMDETFISSRFFHYQAHGEYELITTESFCKVINILRSA